MLRVRGGSRSPAFCTLVARRPLVLPASRFSHILEATGITSSIYANDPLAQLSGRMRGHVLEMVARSTCAELFPDAVTSDAAPGLQVNGSKRPPHQAEYDWLSDGRRVECKSAQLSWWSTKNSWKVHFSGIKLQLSGVREIAAFDDLVLVLHSPFKLDLVQHDLVRGITSEGLRTSVYGHGIMVRGKSNNNCWKLARATILDKLLSGDSGCKHLAELDIDDTKVTESLAHFVGQPAISIMNKCYGMLPLARSSGSIQGNRLQSIAFEVDQLLNPSSVFTFGSASDELRIDGRLRGRNQASFDWCRDGRRIEFKSSLVHWCESRRRWLCHFQRIKFALAGVRPDANFDELWLGIFSAHGLHIFKHDGIFGKTKTGIASKILGESVIIYGQAGQPDTSAALATLLAKLEVSGCELLATVLW
ncbi:unnamed protein product [Polarella glacialis]|uniref:Uncharacterized protein n=1 Tax=Polarella glacialis TaxID=89957 RepID=A0A813HA11_POLGL|nr:unnamed protein product [Polarella glacialis]